MKTRNFYLIVASIIIGLIVFFLMMTAFLELNPFVDSNKITIDGDGTSSTITISISELTSGKYDLVEDKTFHIKNSFETEYDVVYSGISLWSIIEKENLLIHSVSDLEFRFYARDGYSSPKFLNLSIVEANPDLVILAVEENGVPLTAEGPLRSVMDQSVMPEGDFSSQYSVQKLSLITINLA
ncbi:MAG: hypothetical protein ACTSV5_06525 [Promethearchaeota archaeon]